MRRIYITDLRIFYKYIRSIATVSYRSGQEWETRFGRKKIEKAHENQANPCFGAEFMIEGYLDHQVS